MDNYKQARQTLGCRALVCGFGVPFKGLRQSIRLPLLLLSLFSAEDYLAVLLFKFLDTISYQNDDLSVCGTRFVIGDNVQFIKHFIVYTNR